MNNPVNAVDPDGREIREVHQEDSKKVVNDIRALFPDKNFEMFRTLITLSGKQHNGKSLSRINKNDLDNALNGVKLTVDQQALVDLVVNTINSSDLHLIEYVSKKSNISNKGLNNFYLEFDKIYPMDRIIKANGGFPAAFIENYGGGGLTVETKSGTHSIIIDLPYNHPNGISVTVGHELLGHARSLAVGRGRDNQKIDAIQVENLILRVMGINHINNGNNHAPGNIIIQNPTDLPVFR